MSKVVKWGRWPAAIFFALQGLAILAGAVSLVILTLREESGTLYPVYQQLLECSALLLCSWGLLKMRHWAYWMAMGICVLESLGVLILLADVGASASGTWLEMGGLHFKVGSNLIPAAIVFICLAWLALPSVRAQYLHKDLPA